MRASEARVRSTASTSTSGRASAPPSSPPPGARAGGGGGGLVEQVDRLVRQPAVVQPAVRELGGGAQRLVGEADAVELLVALAQALQDPHRLLHEGSGTSTVWKRRASARSARRRYSSQVLEPMQRSRPAVSAGFSRLEASMLPPCVLPAPTRVWISSMKRIACGRFLQLVSTALSRSSKSPR
jgi:hypothetical protein